MFAKVLSISDDLMWRWYTLLSFKSLAEIEALKAEVAAGRNPKEAKVALAKEITSRFHSAAAAEAAEADFNNRARGGIPDEIEERTLPLAERRRRTRHRRTAENGRPHRQHRRSQPPDRRRRARRRHPHQRIKG